MKFFYFFLLSFLFVSCYSSRMLNDSTFRYRSKKRSLCISLGNDSVGKLTNVFRCRKIDEEVRTITTVFTYTRSVDTIFIKNIKCEKENNCLYDAFHVVPPQLVSRCRFLSNEKRIISKGIGPRYITEFEKYGLIPNIDIDTLYLLKSRKLLLMKRRSDDFYVHYFFKPR